MSVRVYVFQLVLFCVTTPAHFHPAFGNGEIRRKFGPCLGMDCLKDTSLHHGESDELSPNGDETTGHSEKGGPCKDMECLTRNENFGELGENGGPGNDANSGVHSEKLGPCIDNSCLTNKQLVADDEEKVPPKDVNLDEKNENPRGPCLGMDCLGDRRIHLNEQEPEMAPDGEQGDSHHGVQNGPCSGPDCLPGVQMHGGEDIESGVTNDNNDHHGSGSDFPGWGPDGNEGFIRAQRERISELDDQVDIDKLDVKSLKDTILGGFLYVKDKILGSHNGAQTSKRRAKSRTVKHGKGIPLHDEP